MNPTAPRPTLLVIDRDFALCYLFAYLLNKHGFGAISAGSAEVAIKLYRDHWREIAAVLLDLKVSDLDGLEVLAQLRQINSNIRAILMTEHAGQLTPQQHNEPNVVAALAKPFTIDLLLEVLTAAGLGPPIA
jgi:two-component system response regulator GlrR